jgi:aminoglycoside N3'-acetyltransferase
VPGRLVWSRQNGGVTQRWSVDDITGHLRQLGVVEGDVVMVHTSLRAIGPVDGGADGLIDALEGAVGSGGTLLVNVGVRNDWDWVNERPEAERAELLRDAEPFDKHLTPSDPDVGVLAEVFRTRSGTLVSNNPEGRLAARGLLARQLLDDAPWHDYYGPGSPLERLVQARGRVLRLGADIDTVTLLHYAEYLAPVPSKRRVRRHRIIATSDGPQLCTVECLDDSGGIVEYDDGDYFSIITQRYIDSGRAATGAVGHAPSELIEAADLVDFAVAWMTDHLAAT